VIGPIERGLIFGLGLAGYATAAAIIVSAKGLLRFPELNALKDRPGAAAGARTIDEVTEYLLVGSLTSWALALFALVLAA
jgi:3-dehydroquinate dehydratase